METVTITNWQIGEDLPGENRILGSLPEKRGKIKVVFQGENNILFFEKGISRVKSLSVTFKGSNSVVYLSGNRHQYNMIIHCGGRNTCMIGNDLFNNNIGPPRIDLDEGDDLMIGNDCLFSVNIRMRSGGSDILLGDHVWLGHGVRLKRGVTIESGAVLGSGTVAGGARGATDEADAAGTTYTAGMVDAADAADAPGKSRLDGRSCWITRNGRLEKILSNIVYTTDSLRVLPEEALRDYDSLHPKTLAELLSLTETTDFSLLENAKALQAPQERLKMLTDTEPERSYTLPKHRSPSAGSLLRKMKSKVFSRTPGGENIIEGLSKDRLSRASIVFEGRGNALIVEEGADLADSRIRFVGSDSVIYISRSSRPYNIVGQVHNGTNLFIGPDNRFDEKRKTRITVSEARSVIIGSGCSFGKDVWIRTSDQHAIYDISSRKRLNFGRDVLIGSGNDHEDGHIINKGANTVKSAAEKEAFEKAAHTLSSSAGIDTDISCLKELALLYRQK